MRRAAGAPERDDSLVAIAMVRYAASREVKAIVQSVNAGCPEADESLGAA